jgi:hypothetical protein
MNASRFGDFECKPAYVPDYRKPTELLHHRTIRVVEARRIYFES